MQSAGKIILIGGLALATVGASLAHGEQDARAKVVTIPLSIATLEGVVAHDGIIRLPQIQRQHHPDYIVLEAEDAQTIRLEQKIFQDNELLRGMDPEASNGRFVAYIEEIVFEFEITEPGDYIVMSRVWAPGHGSWNHGETMDAWERDLHVRNADEENKRSITLPAGAVADSGAAGAVGVVDLLVREPHSPLLKKWIWVRPEQWSGGPRVYQLNAGRHQFKFNYQGGIRLDKLILTRRHDELPTGTGPAAERGLGPLTGHVVTDDVQPYRVKRWLGIRGIQEASLGGTIRRAYSLDRGATWTPFVHDDELAALPVRGDGTDTIRFRFDLERGANHATPILQGLQVVYESARDEIVPAALDTLPLGVVTTLERLALSPIRMEGCVAENGEIRLSEKLFVMQPGKPLVIEAEDFAAARFDPNRQTALRADPTASGGWVVYQYPHCRNQIRYDFSVPQAGDYRLYYRIRFDQVGAGWTKLGFLSVNHGTLGRDAIVLPDNYRPEQGWVLAPGPTLRNLAAGSHSFYLRGRLDYSHLDQLLLLPANQTPEEFGLVGAGPFPAATPQPQDFGVVHMAAVRLPGVRHWKGIEVEAERVGGQVLGKVSQHGDRWLDIARLAELETNAGQDGLWIKIALQRAPGGPSPVWKKAWLVADAPEARSLVLRNETTELRLSPDGYLVGLLDRRNDRWIVPLGSRLPLVELSYQVPGETALRRIVQQEAQLLDRSYREENGVRSLAFTFGAMDNSIRLTFTFSLREDDSLVNLKLDVVNDSPFIIRDLTALTLRDIHLNATGLDETLAWPHHIGNLLPDPGAGMDTVTNIRYPGNACMAWLDVSDPRGGFYFASLDEELTLTDLVYDPGVEAGGWNLRCTLHRYLPKGSAWSVGFELGPHNGDWHWGADHYHERFYARHGRPRYPEWVKMSHGWWNAHGSQRLYSRFVTHWYPRAQWLGFRHCQDWGTTADGESCGFVHLYNPRFGSSEQLRRANRELRARGAHWGGYLNVQGWSDEYARDPEFLGNTPKKFFPAWFLKLIEPVGWADAHAVMPLSGQIPKGGPGLLSIPSHLERHMCLADNGPGGWLEHQKFWLAEMGAKRHAVSVSYIDQTSCIPMPLCYNESHGHGPDHAAAGRNLTRMLKETVLQGRRHNPDYTLAVEGLVDVHAQWAPMGLYVGSEQNKGDLYLYTHPWHFYYRGSNNGGGWDPIPRESHAFYLNFLHNRYDGFGESENLRDCLFVREQVKDWMYNGRFRDNVGLVVDKGGVLAKWFWRDEARHRGAVVTVANLERVAGARATLTGSGLRNVRHALAYRKDRRLEVLPVTSEANGLSFDLPDTEIAAILLIETCPDRERLRVTADRPLRAGEDVLVISLANLSDAPRSVTVTVQTEPRTVLEPARFKAVVPAGAVVEKTLLVPHLQNQPVRSVARVSATTAAGAIQTEALLAPAVLNGDFERYRDTTADVWHTYSAGVSHGLKDYAADAPAPLTGLDGTADHAVSKSGRTSLRLDGRTRFRHRRYPHSPHAGLRDREWFEWTQDISQSVILKPDTRYELSFFYRPDKRSGELEVMLLDVQTPGDFRPIWKKLPYADVEPRVWHEFRQILLPTRHGGVHHLTFKNNADGAVWIDDVRLTEVRP